MRLGSSRFKLWARCIISISILFLISPDHSFASNCDQCVFVSPSGNDNNDGLSWATAKKTISKAINATSNGGGIHVAAGLYLENIELESNVQILGAGADQTIIEGTGNGPVVIGRNLTKSKLDGFTITGGDNTPQGGGIYILGSTPSVIISNNVIENNHSTSQGGGVYLSSFEGRFNNNTVRNNTADGGGAGLYSTLLLHSGQILSNTFYGNTAKTYGGGMALYNSYGQVCSNTINNNQVFNDTVTEGSGGGVSLASFSGVFSKNLIHNNSAKTGGGLLVSDLEPMGEISNCTITENTARGIGDGVLILPDFTGKITNTIIWNNGDDDFWRETDLNVGISYCNIQGWDYGGVENSAADPLFADPGNNDYRLSGGSGCINNGDPSSNYNDSDDTANDRGYTGWVCAGIIENNTCPVANAGGSQTVAASACDGTYVTLDSSSSYDSDGCIESYTWTWDGGSASGCSPTVFLPVGTTNITLTLSDGECTATSTVSHTVNAIPTIEVEDIPDETVDEGESFSSIDLDNYLTFDSIYQASQFNWTASGNIELSVSIDSETHLATITAPNENWYGSETITFKTVDPCYGTISSDTAEYSKNSVNDDPTAVDDSGVTSEDTQVTINVLNNDSDIENDELSVESVTDGTYGTVVNNGDGTVTYTPDPDENGSDSFTYTLSDGNGGSDTATVSVTIAPVEDAPVANADSFTVVEGGSVNIDLLANDTDPDNKNYNTEDDDTLSIESVSNGGHGTVADNGDGTVTYTATDPDYTGTDSFGYSLSDGTYTRNGTANGNLTNTNDCPVANDDSFITSEDTSATIDVLANDTDTDGDTLAVASVTQPTNGSVVINGDHTITYSPNADYNGSDSFTYTISDSICTSITATVSGTINPVNDAPTTTGTCASQTVEAGQNFASFDLCAYITDTENDCANMTWTYSGNTDLSVSITGSTANVSKPDCWVGSEPITFTANDAGLTTSFSCTFTGQANQPPVVSTFINQTAFEATDFSTISLNDYASDPDTAHTDDTITWTASVVGELLVTIDSDTHVATISKPSNYWSGNNTITFTATDPCGASASNSAAFTVVNSPPVCTSIPNQTAQCSSSIFLDGYATDANTNANLIRWTATSNNNSVTASVTTTVDIENKATITGACNSQATITFRATDPGDSYCEQAATYTFADTTAPTIENTSTTKVLITSTANNKWTEISPLITVTASDNCTDNPTLTNDGATINIFPLGETSYVTYTATDACGNTSTYQVAVEVSPGNAPSMSCVSDITVCPDTSAGTPKTNSQIASWLATVTASDHNGESLTVSNNAPDTFANGTSTTVIFTATDPDNNKTSTCSATVTVGDETAPVISCPSNYSIDQTDSSGISRSSLPSYFAATATDNCGNSNVTITNNIPDQISVGNTTATFTATDAALNTSTCTAIIAVNAVGGGSGTSSSSAGTSASSATSASNAESSSESTSETTSTDNTDNETNESNVLVITSPSNGAIVSSSPITVSYRYLGVTKTVSKALTEGENSITIEEDIYSASITVTLDSTPPKVVITSPENGATVTTTQLTVTYLLDGVPKNTSKTLEEGTNVITVEETDASGRTGSDTVTVTLESKPPELVITSPTNNITVARSPIGIAYTVNGELKTVSKTLQEGENNITISEKDSFGRTGSAQVAIILDPNAALVVITSPENGAAVDSSPITVSYTVDGQSKSISKELVQGINTITVTETNSSGHAGSASITVDLDNTAPTVTITSPKDGATVEKSPVTVTYTVDGKIKTTSKELQNGENTISVTETDSLGRTGSASIRVTLNSSAPKVIITSPKNGETLNMTPIVVTYTVNGATKSAVWNLLEGKNEITVTETDTFGRTGSATINVTFARSALVCPKDATIEQKTPKGTTLQLEAIAPDPEKPVKNITSDKPDVFPAGTTIVTFSGELKDGENVSCTCNITVADTKPPKLTLLLSPKKKIYTTDESVFITHLVQDEADPKPKIKIEITNGEKGKAKDITNSASLPLKLDKYLGTNVITLTATDKAGNKKTTSVEFQVILALGSSNLSISSPQTAKQEEETFTVTIDLPKPYGTHTIKTITVNGEKPLKTILKKKGKKVSAAIFTFQRKHIKGKAANNKFEIKGTFSHKENKYDFIGKASTKKAQSKQKPKTQKQSKNKK